MDEEIESKLYFLSFLKSLIEKSNDPRVTAISLDNDHKSGEIILTWEGRDFVISSQNLDLED